MRFCIFDFETASACDLKKCGAWVYSESPTTEIICLGYALWCGAAIVKGSTDLQFNSLNVADQRAGSLEQLVTDSEVIFVCHNASFEKSIWRNIMVPLLGWPDIPDERWLDTMASCAMKGLPLALEKASKVLRLAVQKDTEGTKVTLALSRLNKKGYYERTPEKIDRAMSYCIQDCRGELELYRRVRGLGPEERKVWLLDQSINQRGVRLDMAFVAAAQKVCDDAAKPMRREFEELTGLAPTQDKKFTAWLLDQGCQFPLGEDGEPIVNLQKETVNKLLGEHDEDEEDSLADFDESGSIEGVLSGILPHSCRRSLRIRKILGSRSISKLRSMQACVGSDGRARWLLQYHGAGPGRWAGRLLQPQNFPRPTLKIGAGWNEDGTEKFVGHDPDQLVAAILTGDADYVSLCFGEPIEAVSNGLRHALVPADGALFEVGDFTQVEARIVLALAGQHDKTALMAGGMTPYIPMAESIFKRKIDKHVDVKEYTLGKATVLGCGFQMGAKKFRLRYCPNETPAFAQAAIDAYRKDFAPMVPKLWYALEAAATKAVWDRVPQEAYGVLYALEDGWLTARLPSGRKLWYYDPRPERKKMPWDENDIRPGFTYGAWKIGQWKRITAYGGLLCLGPRTEVLTHRGFMPIVNVQSTDYLWDGTEWVQHDGVVFKGQKEVIDFGGIQITPDHKIWTGRWELAANCSYDRAVSICKAVEGKARWDARCRALLRSEPRESKSLADEVRLLTDKSSYEARLLRRGREFLRLQHEQFETPAETGNADARHVNARSLFCLEVDAGPLPSPNTSGLEKLRGPGYNNLRAMERVREFLDRYEPFVSSRLADRTHKQRRAILSRELPVGHPWRSSPEQADEYLDRHTSRAHDYERSSSHVWGRENYPPLEIEKRVDGEGSMCPVYDILNAGPFHRFVVRGSDGREIIVSNCENVVQALARDLLVHALFNMERARHPVVLTVHDEGVTEVPEAMADAKLLEQMMTDIPQWAKAMQVPIGAECWVGDRYRK